MPSITAAAVLKRASILLQDAEFIRWQEDELLDWLNEGQREYVRLRPDAYVRTVEFTLKAGAHQDLPGDGADLIELPRNKNGSAIRIVARRSLDTQIRDWSVASRAKPIVAHYCYDIANPKVFQVYPPSPGGNVVEMVYHAIPGNLALSGVLLVDDNAAPALISYLMFRALSKDAEFAADSQAAAGHLNAFIAAATGKTPPPVQTGPSA